ncbi:hypothetical protein HC031_07585 [Planosporangium thailandense]|uniref:WD40 repeat protein n=1 Tax=Planosporangium thailandense TaxID=765197 RepID=A0ABX0XWA8_9ACTN|nr:hypothetical protein [Planosporangium thailandense]NJC69582.1 hypothetical protein [Planosporangium thailandense]
MTASPWRLRAAATAALAAVAVLLALPTPRTAAPAAPAGPLTLTQAWPAARTVNLAATMPDGSRFFPSAVLDPGHLVGTVSTADGNHTDLVELAVADPTHPRILQGYDTAAGTSIDAVTAAGGRIYWMTSTPDDLGRPHTSLYRAEAAGGQPRDLTDDTGRPDYYGTRYDLQVADGRVYWIATRNVDPPTSELRSIAVDGGPVSVRPLDSAYALTAWPWLTSTPPLGQPLVQLNAVTGERRTIAPKPGEQLSCSPTWCRGTTSNATSTVITMRRLDGGGEVRVNTDGEGSATMDVAVLDRFELLAAPLGGPTPTSEGGQRATTSEKLTVYDLKTRRRVAVAVATAEGVHSPWLWWSTGDNETLTWHLLDLTTLK